MSDQKNEELVLESLPHGVPKLTDWKLTACAMPDLKDNEVLVKSSYISVDPYLRGLLKRGAKAGDVIVSGMVGEVVQSTDDKYSVGDNVLIMGQWRRFNAVPAAKIIRKVDAKQAPLSTALGVLGMPGQTAYFGLLDAGQLKEGDVVLVSGAAGAVGSVVGQIAKLKGCFVVGTCGSQEKIDYITKECGFDVGLNYKELKDQKSMKEALEKVCPNGIDCYFENTGGHVTDACFDLINKYGRVAVCGQISIYNSTETPMAPLFLHKLIYKSVNVRGFVVTDYMKEMPRFFADMPKWVAGGQVKYRETVIEGFENIPQAFIGLFKGSNIGKQVVKV